LSQWVSDRENDKWRIYWPTAEGTFEAIKLKMLELNVGVGPRIEKPKKADYAAALGRAESIQHLNEHFSGMANSLDVILA